MAKKAKTGKTQSIGTTLQSLTQNFAALARDAQLVALMELTNFYRRTKTAAQKADVAAKPKPAKKVAKAVKAAKPAKKPAKVAAKKSSKTGAAKSAKAVAPKVAASKAKKSRTK